MPRNHYKVSPTGDLTQLRAELNKLMAELSVEINQMKGSYNAPVKLHNDLDLQGHKIINANPGPDAQTFVSFSDLQQVMEELAGGGNVTDLISQLQAGKKSTTVRSK